MVEHAGALVRRFVRPGQRVLEIASNDGYLLRQAQDGGATVLGVDPARNIAAHASESGVPTRCAYFTADEARRIVHTWSRADVLFANNVLAHVPDPHEIAEGIGVALAPHGVAHVEVPYVASMLEAGAFDTLYHEHQCCFSVSALRALFHRHRLRIINVELMPVHGGSLHLMIAHSGEESIADRWCADERREGLFDDRPYRLFARHVSLLRQALGATLGRFSSLGAYGAAAKGVLLLNVLRLDSSRIPWVADVSPHKQGRFIPGTGQPIVPPQRLLDDQPQACLLLPWNLRDEIIATSRAYLERGGRFVVPIPRLEVLDARSAIRVDTPAAPALQMQ
jgi:SAM-dependent methyltransferase